MPYIGNSQNVGDHVNNFKVLDDISSYTATFNGSAASVVSTTNETIRVADHRFVQGQRVTYSNGGGSNIGGLTSGTTYFISFDSANTIKLATSLVNANNNTVINLSSVGSGSSHTLTAAFDGVNTEFKLTYGGKSARLNNAAQLNVAINNVIQRPNLNPLSFTEGFAVKDGNKIIFQSAPEVNDVFWGSIISNTIDIFDVEDNAVDNFTGDGSTTNFTLSTIPPNKESILVTLDGVVQHPSDNSTTRAYTIDASVVVFTSAPANGVAIQVRHIGFASPTAPVRSFYGRTGNVTLTSSDHITTGDITSRNINSSGIITASSFSGSFSGAISGTSISATSATFSGDVSIGGTLTYEDVKNVDSVGFITARSGILVQDDATFTGAVGNMVFDKSDSALEFGDNVSAVFGTDDDGSIKHTGANLQIFETTGNIQITNYANDKDVVISSDDGSGGTTPYFAADGSTGKANLYHYGGLKLETNVTGVRFYGHSQPTVNNAYDLGASSLNWRTVYAKTGDFSGDIDVDGHTNLDNVSIAGVTTFVGDVLFDSTAGSDYDMQWTTSNGQLRIKDDGKLVFGTSGDVSVYHNDTDFYLWNTKGNSYIQNTGDVYIRTNNTENSLKAIQNGAVEVYYDGSKKIETSEKGIKVGTGVTIETNGQATYTGIITATAFKLADGSAVGGFDPDAQNNLVAGNYAGDGFSGTSAEHNITFGYQAGTNISTGDKNICIGRDAGRNLTNTNENVFIGDGTGNSWSGGQRNVCVGPIAGWRIGGSYNVFLGHSSGGALTGHYNIAIGQYAGGINGGSVNTGSNNIFIGRNTHEYQGSSQEKNTIIGNYACQGSSGNEHTGDNNLILGYNAQPSSNTVSNEITLGDSDINHFRVPGIGVSFSAGGGVVTGIMTATSYRGDGSQLTGVSSVGGNTGVDFNDSVKARFGTGNDLEIFHDGSHTYIENNSSGGELRFIQQPSSSIIFRANVGGGDITQQVGWDIDGSGNWVPNMDSMQQIGYTNKRPNKIYADNFYGDGSNLTGVSSVGGSTGVDFSDDVLVRFGNANDLQLYHNSGTTANYIDSHNGRLYIRGSSNEIKIQSVDGEEGIIVKPNGATELYHDDEAKILTESNGATVQDLTATGTYLNITSSSGNNGKVYGVSGTTIGFLDNQNHWLIKGIKDGATQLYHNNTLRLTTFDNNPFVGVSVTNDLILNGSGDTAIRWAVGGNAVGNFKWGMYYANADGALRLFDNVNSRTLMVWKNDGTIELNYQGSKKLHTISAGLQVTGNVYVNDGNTYTVGGNNDGQYFHNGTDTYLSNSTNKLRIGNTHSNEIKFFTNNNTRWNVGGTGHIYPDLNNTYDIGNTTYRVRNIYTNDLNLSNEGSTNSVDNTWGDYTIQEGENDLFLINNRNGKKYKFNLTEVS